MASNSNKASWKDFKQAPSGDDALVVTEAQVVGGSASQKGVSEPAVGGSDSWKGFATRTLGGDDVDRPSAQARTMEPQATAQGAKSYGRKEQQGIGALTGSSRVHEPPMPEPMPDDMMPRPSRRQGLDLSGIKGDDNSLAVQEGFCDR